MTISTTDWRVSYTGNAATTVFSFPYRFLANEDIVVVEVTAAGVSTVKTLTTHYTMTGADDDAGGTVTMLVAPASGVMLVIYRDTIAVQETDYISGDPFPAETHERALDRLTMIVQEKAVGLASRSITVPVGDSDTLNRELPASVARVDRLLAFNAVNGEVELSTFTSTQVASAVAAAYAAGSTADAVTFLQAGTGSVSRTSQDKMRERISAADKGAVADGATDNTAAVQLALNALPMYGGEVLIASGARFNLRNLTFPAKCNLVYRADDDLSTPGPYFDIGSGEWVNFSSNSGYPLDPSSGAVNEWRFTSQLHPGITIDVRKDVLGGNANLNPSQSLIEPARASVNIMDEQTDSHTLLYQSFYSNSVFSGVTQRTNRRVVALSGVGTGNWGVTPAVGERIVGQTSGAMGFFISTDAGATYVHWFNGKFIAGENLVLASPLTVSATTVTSVLFTLTAMQPLSQDLKRGNWSIGLPPGVPTHLFAVGGKIAATATRTFSQHVDETVTHPALVLIDSYEAATPAGFEITYNVTPDPDKRRLTLRNLGGSADRGLIGGIGCSAIFSDTATVSTSSFNVANVTKDSTGTYTVTFTSAFQRADYAVSLATSRALEYAYITSTLVGSIQLKVVTTGTSTPVDLTGNLHLIITGGDV